MRYTLLVAAVSLAAGCISSGGYSELTSTGGLELSSPAFTDGGGIPGRYTCDGENVSPPLEIGGVPGDAVSLVLTVDDPDAPMGVWDHWVVWDIPPDTSAIAEGSLPAGSVEGLNSFKKHKYGGPCPPSGTHRYFFKLYALDAKLDLTPDSKKADVEKALEGHVLAQTQLTGTYRKT